jgi:hypothetical protein
LGLHSDLMEFEAVANDLHEMQEDSVETDCEVKVGDKVCNSHEVEIYDQNDY